MSGKSILISLYILISFCMVSMAQEKPKVVATSTWTADYARLAGIESLEVLAPSEMQHPSEYEIQIDDIRKLMDADLIICGGYEIMMEEVRTGLNIPEDRILQIVTDYDLEHIRKSVQTIADRTNTLSTAEKNLKRIEQLYADAVEQIQQEGISRIPVVVQFFLRTFAAEIGMNVQGIYGPRQLEAFDIQELMQLDFTLILDNAHNPSARPLSESREGVKIVYLINFPGMGGTSGIEDVIRYNVDRILSAALEE